jgi:hypothetical protein
MGYASLNPSYELLSQSRNADFTGRAPLGFFQKKVLWRKFVNHSAIPATAKYVGPLSQAHKRIFTTQYFR